MTVTVDVVTESIRTVTTDPWQFSHLGGASPEGVLVAAIHGTSSTDHIVSVTYGSAVLTRVRREIDNTSELGAAEWWFKGSGIPTGTRTVEVEFTTATGDDFQFVCITLNGSTDLEVVDNDGIANDTANPQRALQYASRTCMAFCALYGGGAAPTSYTSLANQTRVHDNDFGAFVGVVDRQTTAGTSDFTIGYTSSSDDVAFVAVAVSEVAPQNVSPTAQQLTLGGGPTIDQSVPPPTIALVLGAPPPTALDLQTHPAAQGLALGQPVPEVGLRVQADQIGLILDLFAPTSEQQVTPGTNGLALGQPVPSVSLPGLEISPEFLNLVLSLPSSATLQDVSPAAQGLTLGLLAPTFEGIIQADSLGLALGQPAPSVTEETAPAAQSLTLGQPAPDVSQPQAQNVEPAANGLVLAQPAPAIGGDITPAAQGLTLGQLAPQVQVDLTVELSPQGLALGLLVPVLTQPGQFAPPTQTLTLTALAPSISVVGPVIGADAVLVSGASSASLIGAGATADDWGSGGNTT